MRQSIKGISILVENIIWIYLLNLIFNLDMTLQIFITSAITMSIIDLLWDLLVSLIKRNKPKTSKPIESAKNQ